MTSALVFAITLLANDEFFEQKIRPVLVEKCYSCHNSKLKAAFGGLRLDTAAGLKRGGDSGPVVVPGKPEESLLYQALRYDNTRLKMPPTGRLPESVAADFRNWIAAGAVDPRVDQAPVSVAPPVKAPAPPHWAFQPLRPYRGGVDDLMPATAPIGKREWLRRVTFDLIGLPPSPTEIRDFLADSSPGADRKVVDRLLASPHYGERWARHWLDLVRFCETNGHEFDNDKIDAWRYRDYAIRAFNDDLPYDQFVRENIAGDLVAKPRLSRDGAYLESPIASTMMWFGEVLNSATDPVKVRSDEVDNQVDVLSKSFLGLTLSCARCHDHKFDPLPTREYYGIAGVMHSTSFREDVIDSPARVAEIAAVREKATALTAQIDKLRGGVRMPKVALRPATDEAMRMDGWYVAGQAFASRNGMPALTGSLTSPKFKMPKLWVHILLRGDIAETNSKDGGPLRVTLVNGEYKAQNAAPRKTTDWQWASMRMTLEISRICYIEVVDRDRNKQIEVASVVFSDEKDPPQFTVDPAPPISAADQERIAKLEAERAKLTVPESTFALISHDENPHDIPLHIRGSHENLGPIVPRGFLKAVRAEWAPVSEASSGRMELADWIASPKNPLTARVFVNRVWMHHFGVGLVKSVDNFGKMGEAPSNPDLLDSLARGFIDNGWSVKWLHRQILLSKAYRGALPVRRLEAEAIRDSILAVSGRLDRTLYGKSVPPHISEYQDGRGKPKSGPLDGDGRRSVYIEVRRNFVTPMFLAFDYPLPISTIGGRGSSTVPSQALLMMNNAFVLQQAKFWADRVTREQPDESKRIAQLYQEAFARDPKPEEVRETLAFARANSWADLCHVLFNSAEFIYVQ